MSEHKNIEVSFNDLLNIAERMSNELQEFVDAGNECGSKMEPTEALLNEFNEMLKKTDTHWLNQLQQCSGLQGVFKL